MNEQEVKRHYHREFPNDAWYDKRPNYHYVVSLSGQGRSGKTTLAKMLAKNGYGMHVTFYSLRDTFESAVYQTLERSDPQRNEEVFGMASLGWMIAEFHWRVKPYLNEGKKVIFDHFFFDFFAEMMPEVKDMTELNRFIRSNRLPRVDRGCHFFLDIDYKAYKSRSYRTNVDGTKQLQELNVTPEDIFNERRKRYLKLSKDQPLIRIDATTSIEKTYAAIVKHIKDYYQLKGI